MGRKKWTYCNLIDFYNEFLVIDICLTTMVILGKDAMIICVLNRHGNIGLIEMLAMMFNSQGYYSFKLKR